MFSIGENVLYGANGVCKISDISVKKVGKASIEYYELKPLYSNLSTLFIPTANEALVSKMRYLCSAEEIREILSNNDAYDVEWCDNKVDRLAAFKEIVSSGECPKLISLVRLLLERENMLSQKGKKLHISDERILKEAQRMVFDEVSTALEIERDEVLSLIIKQDN